MKSVKVFFLLAMMMALLAISLSSTPYEFEESFFSGKEDKKFFDHPDDNLPMASKSQEKTSLRGTSSFLASRAVTTCDHNPKVCGAANCCHKKCVDLKTDKLNCGECGVKSHHSQICCNGHLVNPMSDKKHCGSCDNRCHTDGSGAFGMCSYA